MKINESHRVGGVGSYRKNQDVKSAAGSKKSLGRDEVRISSEAKELLESQAASANPKLDSLKQAVSSGTYRVDAQRLAEKLLPFLK